MIPDMPSLVQVNLRYGRDRARKLGELAEDMGVPRRVIEQSIESLRKDGVPIVTGSDGVWLSTDSRELADAAERLRSRALHILLGARALRRTARRFERVQQTELFEPTWADRAEDRMREDWLRDTAS